MLCLTGVNGIDFAEKIRIIIMYLDEVHFKEVR